MLAQKVLAGGTKGYRHHPQLARFQAQADPRAAIASFLRGLAAEAQQRGYNFDTTKIARRAFTGQIAETRGQLRHEWEHLQAKLRARAPELARQHRIVVTPEPHPLFHIVPVPIREWERT